MGTPNKMAIPLDGAMGQVISRTIDSVIERLAQVDERIAFSVIVHAVAIVAKSLDIELEHVKDCLDDAWEIIKVKGHSCTDCNNCAGKGPKEPPDPKWN